MKRKDFNIDEDCLSDFSSEPDYSSFTESETDSDADVEETLFDVESAPPLPERNSNSNTEIGCSSSNDSFPKGQPCPIAHLPKTCTSRPRSSHSSYPASTDTDSERDTLHTTRKKMRSQKCRTQNREQFRHEIQKGSMINLPGLGLVRRFASGTCDYINPVYSSKETGDSENCLSSCSNDSFPNVPAQPLRLRQNE